MSTQPPDETRRRTSRIEKRRRYVFGPVPRGAEHDPDSDEMVPFATTAEGGVNYPREYPGSYFLDTLGVATFDDYLARNPEGLKPGRRFFFYEKTDTGETRLMSSGTMMPARGHDGQGYGQGLRDGANANGQQQMMTPQIVVAPNAQDRGQATRGAFEDMIETLRGEITSLRDESSTLQRRVDELSRAVINAEQQRIAAEAALESAKDKHQRELENMRDQHQRELDTYKQMHDKDLEILTAKAIDEARKDYEQQLADAEPETSFAQQALEGLAPVLAPVASSLGEALALFVENALADQRAKKAARKGLHAGAPGGAQAQPGVQGQPGQAQQVQAGSSNGNEGQHRIAATQDAADIFSPMQGQMQ